PTYLAKIAGSFDETIEMIFAGDYPTAATLGELRLQAQQVDEKSGQLSSLSEQRQSCEKLLAEHALLLRQQQGLEERYLANRERAILLAFQQEQQRLEAASVKRKALDAQLRQA